MECASVSPRQAVLIDSLLSMDQYRSADKATCDSNGRPGRDIAEVAAATELILPKGSFRTTLSVRTQMIKTLTKIKCFIILKQCLFLLDSQLSTFSVAWSAARISANWCGLVGKPLQEAAQWHLS